MRTKSKADKQDWARRVLGSVGATVTHDLGRVPAGYFVLAAACNADGDELVIAVEWAKVTPETQGKLTRAAEVLTGAYLVRELQLSIQAGRLGL